MSRRSSSRSTSRTVTNTQNLNLQGIAAPTVIGDGSITLTDQGAVQAAFEAIDRTTAEQQDTLRASNEIMGDVVREAIEGQRGAQSDAFTFASRVQDAAYKWAQDASESEAARITETISKWTMGAASVVALAMVLRK